MAKSNKQVIYVGRIEQMSEPDRGVLEMMLNVDTIGKKQVRTYDNLAGRIREYLRVGDLVVVEGTMRGGSDIIHLQRCTFFDAAPIRNRG